MQSLKEPNILYLDCSQEAVAAPAVCRCHRFPDQPFANLIVAPELTVDSKTPSIPKSRSFLDNTHYTYHLAAMVKAMVNCSNGISMAIEFIAIILFKEVLLFAEDGTAQLPIAIDQAGLRP
jgi:hypothetical protein